MPISVYALAANEDRANTVVTALKCAGFRSDDISVLYPETSNRGAATPDNDNNHGVEGAAIGGASGGMVGGTLGWMAGIGLLAIPGVGPFIAAGPILALLTGAALGAAAGGLAGSFIGQTVRGQGSRRSHPDRGARRQP
jgi:hypothetical protein